MEVDSVKLAGMQEQMPAQAVGRAEPDAVKTNRTDGDNGTKGVKLDENVIFSDAYNKAGSKRIDEESATNKLIEAAIADANKKLSTTNRMLSYAYHKEARRITVKVIDTETNEVIREIPPVKDLDAYAKIMEMLGLLHDEKH